MVMAQRADTLLDKGCTRRQAAVWTAAGLMAALGGFEARAALAGREWSSLYAAWKAAFVQPSGRVVDDGQQGITTSEGQGYGMLLAWAAGDQQGLESMWQWTRTHLAVRDDGLLAWRWSPGEGVTDRNNATDGDLLVAWGLALAARDRPSWREPARALAQSIRGHAVRSTNWGTVLLPATQGFETPRGLVVNLSYWVYPALLDLPEWDPNPVWGELIASGHQLLALARFGTWGLPPDWLLLVDPLITWPERPARYGYEGIRIPLYLAWAGMATPQRTQPWRDFWAQFPRAGFMPAWVDLDNPCLSSVAASPGARLIRDWVESRNPPIVADREGLIRSGYYSATLGMLTVAASRWPAARWQRVVSLVRETHSPLTL